MTLDPRTPVLVGVGSVQQREADPADALEPLALMQAALERAAEDAGSPALLSGADWICAPRGFWDYPDPCRALAERFGATRARTRVSEIGVLQTTLLGRAAAEIAAGEADIVLVTGGEARHRTAKAAATGTAAPLTRLPPAHADEVLRPSGNIITPLEIQRGLAMPVTQYAMIENALRFADGLSIDAHRDEVADLWGSMSRVAAENPDAWNRERVEAATIRDPSARNRMLAFPYTKLHTSQWNVDQAAGLVLCSLATAERLGVPRARWVFPLSVASSDHMLPLTHRKLLHRCPGFAIAGQRALEIAGRKETGVEHLEIYSCFPSAVRVQLRELGLADDRPVTLTGGMTFAGGPFNSFVLQALVRMAEQLRRNPGDSGLLTAVSGVLTKQGASVWSTNPGPGFRFDEVGHQTAAATEAVEVAGKAEGEAQVASYTVAFGADGPTHGIVLVDLPDGRRALGMAPDRELAEAMTRDEFCGSRVRLESDGQVRAT